MPMNNNQKGQSAAARLAKLPVVRSTCTKLSVFYSDIKCSHPSLKSLCEGLESSVTAMLSPAILKLQPQISVANSIASKSLDWLETTFPVVHTPTKQIVATAKNKMREVQDAVSIAASGSVECAHMAVTWLMGRMQQAEGRPLLERAITVASMGLDSSLHMLEVLMDRVLPPTDEEENNTHKQLEGFEVAAPRRSFPVGLVSLTVKLCRRTYNMVMETFPKSPGLVQELGCSWHSLVRSIQALPQYLQQQVVSVFFFLSEMYSLSCPQSQHHSRDKSVLNTAKILTHKVVQAPPRVIPLTCRMKIANKKPV